MILPLKSTVVLSLLFILLGAMVVFGLKTTTLMEKSNGGGGIMVEATKYPLRLTIILNETTFKVGEKVNFTLFVENIGNETLAFHFGYMDHSSYVVYYENGSTVYDFEEHTFWPMVILPPTYVPSGLVLRFQMTWYQKKDAPLPPGTYHLVGGFRSGSLGLIIETPPVTITLI